MAPRMRRRARRNVWAIIPVVSVIVVAGFVLGSYFDLFAAVRPPRLREPMKVITVKNIYLGEGYIISSGNTVVKVNHIYVITWWDASSKTWKKASIDMNIANISYLIGGEWRTFSIAPSVLHVIQRIEGEIFVRFDPDAINDFLPNIVIRLEASPLEPQLLNIIFLRDYMEVEGTSRERQYAYNNSYVEIALSLPNRKILNARSIEGLPILNQYFDENKNYVIVLPLPKTGRTVYRIEVKTA
jgi:hypothetical protein